MHRQHLFMHLNLNTRSSFLHCTFYSRFISVLFPTNFHCVYILIHQVALTSKQWKELFILRVKQLSPTHLFITHGGGFTLFFSLLNVKQKQQILINFIVFGLTRLEIEFEFTVSNNLRSIHSTSDQNNGFEKVLLIVDCLLVFRNYSITITIALTILVLYCYYDNICLLVKVHSCTQSLEYKLFTSLVCFEKVSKSNWV